MSSPVSAATVAATPVQGQRPFSHYEDTRTGIESFAKMSGQKSKKGQDGYVSGELSPKATTLIHEALELFGARPSNKYFSNHWTHDAVFEDPLCYAQGHRQYKAQWFGMPAAFSKSDTLAWYVTKDTPEEIAYVQRQRYTFKGLGFKKELVSKVVMKLNEEGKITYFADRWNDQDPPAHFLVWPLRRLNAVVMPYLISQPPVEETQQGGSGHNDL